MHLTVHLLALVLVSAAVLAGADPAPVQAQQPRGIDEFIAIVQGYDAPAIRRTFPAYNTGLFERLFGSGPPIPLTSPADRALFEQQLVRTPAGVTLDIGHVITGLEASLPLPPTARAVQAATGCSLRAAVTWSGDVGQALFDYLTGAAADPDAGFAASASPEDLYGDIDGYLLGVEVSGPDLDVAALLTRTYLSGNAFEATRFREFVALLGPDPRATAAAEITCFARALAQFSGVRLDPAQLAAAAPLFVDRFIQFVEAGVHAETATTGT